MYTVYIYWSLYLFIYIVDVSISQLHFNVIINNRYQLPLNFNSLFKLTLIFLWMHTQNWVVQVRVSKKDFIQVPAAQWRRLVGFSCPSYLPHSSKFQSCTISTISTFRIYLVGPYSSHNGQPGESKPNALAVNLYIGSGPLPCLFTKRYRLVTQQRCFKLLLLVIMFKNKNIPLDSNMFHINHLNFF